MADTASLQYPVILVHGIVAHDRQSGIPFWGNIPAALRENGARVFFGNTDSWGGYESNAELLRAAVERALRETKNEKVNIIAHSKGGIDARYYIWKYAAADVASLTTIATPHHGAEIADLLYKQKAVHSRMARKALAVFGKLYGDIHPDVYNVNYQLTSKNMGEFNARIRMDERVYYQSLYTTMRNSFDDLMFWYSHRYIKNIRGENDGVISAYSANWGNRVLKIAEGVSHAEIVDYKRKTISGLHIPAIYIQIADDLRDRGF
jgi:triacylglycerol esterase/lipase EstA (alpha/beta hydrolase family)